MYIISLAIAAAGSIIAALARTMHLWVLASSLLRMGNWARVITELLEREQSKLLGQIFPSYFSED